MLAYTHCFPTQEVIIMCSQRTGTILSISLSSLALVMFVANAWLVNGSQAMQQQLNDRQAQIANGVQVSQLNNELVRALGTAVIAKNDTKIKDLLAQHGITVTADKNAKKGGTAATPAAQ